MNRNPASAGATTNQGRVANPPAAGPGAVSVPGGSQKKSRPGDEPTIRSARPALPAPTPATKVATKSPATSAELFAFWNRYYKTHGDDPTDVFATIAPLLTEKKYVDVEAALKSYLLNHRGKAQPWMYEWLIKTNEVLKRPEVETKQAIGFAAMLAKRSKNPNDLVRLADMMVVRNYYGQVGDPKYETNIGELVDLAAEKVPNNAIPPMMSLNLAIKLKDPNRMGDAADRLLSLGWPGIDENIRRNVSQQVEALGKSLRDDGKSDEADALAKRVAEAEVRDLYVSLKWAGEADLDLAVEEPLGAVCRMSNPRTVFGGAILKNGRVKFPEEVYVCPRAFDGEYMIQVETIFNDAAKPAQDATLVVITHEGGADEKREEFRVDLARSEPFKIRVKHGRRREVLPFIAPNDPPAAPSSNPEGTKAKPTTGANPVNKPATGIRPAPIR